MKLLSWMHRKFQGTRVNPCKEPPPAEVIEESSKNDEESVAPAAHYFLIRRKDSGEPWIPLKIAPVDDQQSTAEEKEKPHMVNSLLATPPKKTKLPFSLSNCFHPGIVDETPATLSSLVEDQLGLLAIGTFGLREFADGELGDLEGFEMFVGASESELRSKLNIPEPAEDTCLSENLEKQVLEIGKGVCAQGFRRDSPVFGENPEGELQVFGGYCWELRGKSGSGDGAEEHNASSDLKIVAVEEDSKTTAPEDNTLEITVTEEGKDMLSVQKFLDSYDIGVPPNVRKRGNQQKLLHRIARFLGSRTQTGTGQLPALKPAPKCRPDERVDAEVEEEEQGNQQGKGKHDLTKTTNPKGLAHRLLKLRSKSSNWTEPLTRLRQQTSHATKKVLRQGSSGKPKMVCNNMAFTCGTHHPRRKRSGRPQLRDLFDEPLPQEDTLTSSSQEVCAQIGSDAEAPSILESCKAVDQSPERVYTVDSQLIIDWASDGDEEFVSQTSDSDEEFELSEKQWLKSDSEYFVLEL